MAPIVAFLIIFAVCWLLIAAATFVFELIRGIWWGATIRKDSDLLLKIYGSEGVPVTLIAAILSGVIWYWLW